MRCAWALDTARRLGLLALHSRRAAMRLALQATTVSGVPSSCATPAARRPTVVQAVGVAELLEGELARRLRSDSSRSHMAFISCARLPELVALLERKRPRQNLRRPRGAPSP